MITDKNCPVCGGFIAFSYVRPNYDFYILDGKIEQDTNKELWDGTDSHLDFYCSNDRTHMSDDLLNAKFTMWIEQIKKEFYEKIFPHL